MMQIVMRESAGGPLKAAGASIATGAAYTMTYGQAPVRTLAATTAAAVDATAPVVVPTTAIAGFGAAQAAAILTNLNAVIADHENTKKVLKQLIADLQTHGLIS